MPDYRQYWQDNIARWSELYLDISHGHEKLEAPHWLGKLYNSTIAKHEARLMRQRYELTARFIDRNVSAGCVFADIGCGSGIFVVEALKRKARVCAIDFSDQSLALTKANVERYVPNGDVSYHKLDISQDELPRSDVAIMVGVAPYLSDMDSFLDRILASTDILLIQYVDPYHWANRVRRLLPFLNVRRLIFHSPRDVALAYTQRGWRLLERVRFGTGFIDIVCRSDAAVGAPDRMQSSLVKSLQPPGAER